MFSEGRPSHREYSPGPIYLTSRHTSNVKHLLQMYLYIQYILSAYPYSHLSLAHLRADVVGRAQHRLGPGYPIGI